jgi:hypothetical protein
VWREVKIILKNFISGFKIINMQKFWSCNPTPSSSSSTTGLRWLMPPEVLQPAGLLYEPGFGISCLYRQEPPTPRQQRRERPLAGKEELWARTALWILLSNSEFQPIWRDLLHAENLRHGTDGFTSSPKEGMLRIFSPWKIRRLRVEPANFGTRCQHANP